MGDGRKAEGELPTDARGAIDGDGGDLTSWLASFFVVEVLSALRFEELTGRDLREQTKLDNIISVTKYVWGMTCKKYWNTCPHEIKIKGNELEIKIYLPLLAENDFTFLFDFFKGLLDPQ